MGNYFTFILMITYFTCLIFMFKTKITNSQNRYTDQNIKILIDKIYIDIISFNNCKNFTKSLQLNLKYQIYALKKLPDDKTFSIIEYLDCIKDSVDINDLTFYVGNNTINMLLRKKVRECKYLNITLDVVADLSEINIDKTHLFLILSNLIDLSIKYLKQKKEEDQKSKISIRAVKKNLKNNNFLVIQIAYNIIDNIKDIDINEYYPNMMYLISSYYNGTIFSKEKNGKIVKTVMLPLLR